MTKITAMRALTVYLGRRILLAATLLAVTILLIVIIITALLAYFFSAWWWLLLLPFVIVFLILLVVRQFISLILGRIHAEKLSKTQKDALEAFSEKVQALLEARATPLPVFVAISVKDLVIHRDITTIKKLISDTAGLRRDFAELEKLF